MQSVGEILNEALRHHQADDFPRAEALYRQVLQADPQCSQAWNLFGVLVHQIGRNDVAEQFLRQAIQINPRDPAFYSNLAEIYRVVQHYEEAAACCRAALDLQPDHSGALNNLGLALFAQGQHHEALACYQRALAVDPQLVEAHNNLGTALKLLDRWDEAVACFREAIRLRPSFAEAHNNLASMLELQGDLAMAVHHYAEAIRLKPDFAEPYYNLGNIHSKAERHAEAAHHYQHALQLKPDMYEVHNNLGGACKALGNIEGAKTHYREAFRLQPDFAQGYFNLAVVYDDENRLEEAKSYYLQALQLDPALAEAHNNLGSLYLKLGQADMARDNFANGIRHKPELAGFASNILLCEQYLPDMSLAKMTETHAAWARTYAEPLRPTWPNHDDRPRDPRRRLRLGFVSSDLRFHPVGCFFLPTLEQFDREQFDTTVYAVRNHEGAMTERLMKAAGNWRQVHLLSEEELAAQIQRDEIDILFDLTGHTAHHRLLTFARKPAPIQAAWIGYPGTLAMGAIDYLIADRWQIPPESERFYTETVLRLPDAWICFQPSDDAPEVGPLPALNSGTVTFGSFNFLAKVTPQVVEAWAQILQRVPHSRLVMLYRGFDAQLARSRYRELFAARGIEQQRLELLGTFSHARLMQQYQSIDIALDPFPYSGGLTSCEALWMGVPVVTCPGETFTSRHTLSLLSTIGLTETIAGDREAYVRTGRRAGRRPAAVGGHP